MSACRPPSLSSEGKDGVAQTHISLLFFSTTRSPESGTLRRVIVVNTTLYPAWGDRAGMALLEAAQAGRHEPALLEPTSCAIKGGCDSEARVHVYT